MNDEPAGPDLVALFYRADWTALRLTARVSGLVDLGAQARNAQLASPLRRATPSVPPARLGVRRFAGTLRLEPGGRFVVDITEPASFDEQDALAQLFLRQNGIWSRAGNAPMRPPFPDLLRPSRLLSGYALELRGEISGTSAPARRALVIVATRVPGGAVDFMARPDQIEVIADADTGILLRSEERLDGDTLRVTELTDVTFGEPGAAFAVPEEPEPGFASRGSAASTGFSGPGWTAARAAMNAAGAVLGSLIAHAPECHDDDLPDPEAAMPPDEEVSDPASPTADRPEGFAAVSDELLHALYGSRRAEFSATLHTWTDIEMMARRAGSNASRHGWGGVGFVESIAERVGVVHTVSRVQIGADGRYRVEYLRRQRADNPRTVTCDGEQLWREFADKVVISPAAPLKIEIADMVDTSPMLECGLTVIRETMVGGRRAFVVRASWELGTWRIPQRTHGDETVVDAELGIVLRSVRHEDGKPVLRREFRDVTPGLDDSVEFRGHVPPGVRALHADGSLLDDVLVALPDPVRIAAKAAGSGLRAARVLFDYVNERRGR